MHRRKYEQLKNYSKIIKYKKNGGAAREVEPTAEKIFDKQAEVDQPILNEKLPANEEFEDPFEDQFEQEEGWISESSSEHEEAEHNESHTMVQEKEEKRQTEKEVEGKKEVFLGSNKQLEKGEVLQFDNHAYDMLHRLNVEWPSMSIDFVCRPSPFETLARGFLPMNKYPYQVVTVQGSCNGSNKNSIYLTKWTKLHQTKFDDDEQAPSDDEQPEIVIQQLQTTYDVNRIRALNNSPVVAFWNDDGHRGEIHIMDLTANYQKLGNNLATKRKEKCKQIVIPCEQSGFALSWNPHKVGELAAGSLSGLVSIYNNNENYTQWSRTAEYSYHKGSVEDIVFSPEQAYVFASCSSDCTLQVVDMRTGNYKKAQLKVRAHERDVNVCDWNRVATHLIVTGSDDCTVKVWDLRMVTEKAHDELLCFNWHTEPITSIRFQPNDESVIAVASEDNRLSIWDMAVENEEEDPDVPNELMFLHQGQQQIKQISYHPIYFEMLISTSLDSINIFKPAFEMPQQDEDEKNDKEDLKRPPIREEELDQYLGRMSLE